MPNNVIDILTIFAKDYPSTTALQYNSVFQLLVATILSAQTTDEQVNKITSKLFNKYPTAKDFASLEPNELAQEIRSCGIYKNKSRFIVEMARILVENFQGQVPEKIEELIKLPGVGRKTANVVASVAFGEAAIAVDTHVFRVSHRLGWARSKDALKTEKELMELLPKDKWSEAHHWLIYHGRRVCIARKPGCSECKINNYCEYLTSSQKSSSDQVKK